jgi:bifunctional isochorismate lyase/aryl carrier protein
MHKELYYTSETIQGKAQDLLTSVEFSRHRHADIIFQPRKAALLVLDMQEYFFQEGSHAFIPSAPAIVPGISKLIAAFSSAGYPIITTRHTNTIEDAGMMAKWWQDLINLQISYSQYINPIRTYKTIHINKNQYDAFHHTLLEDKLHQHKIGQVVICGVMTHLCCETTARSAFMRGFEVLFTVDGTATYNEELHRATLLTLSHGFAVPVLVEELLADMEKNAT